VTHRRGVRIVVAFVLASMTTYPCLAADCPSADMIDQAAWDVAAAKPPRDAIAWRLDERALFVAVISKTGTVTQRQIDARNLTCDAMAQAIALVWAAVELGSPELAMLPPAMPEETVAREPNFPEVHAKARVPLAKQVALPGPKNFLIETEVAGLAAWSGDRATPAFGMALTALGAAHWGVHFSGAYVGPMDRDVGPGRGRWTRWTFAAGVIRRWTAQRWLTELETSVLGSRLHITGSRFAANDAGTAADWGGRLGLGLGWKMRPISPRLLIQSDLWFGEQRLLVENLSDRGNVPRWTLSAGLGFAWGSR